MNFYDVLGVPRNATRDEIQAAYRRLSMENHPDQNESDGSRMAAINEAWEILGDPDKRARYDETGQTGKVPNPIESIIAALVAQAFVEGCYNPVRRILDKIDSCRSVHLKNRVILSCRMESLTTFRNKFGADNADTKNPEARDFILECLAAQIAQAERERAICQQEIDTGTAALTYLNGITYRTDTGRGDSGFGGIASWGGTSIKWTS